MAFYEVVGLMQNQAEVFGLTDADIGLDGVDPERDVLGHWPPESPQEPRT